MSACGDYPRLPTTSEGIDQYYAMCDEIDRLHGELDELHAECDELVDENKRLRNLAYPT